MVRRSFRLGLWAGLLLGIGFAVVKTMQARRSEHDTVPPPSRDPWPPVSRVEPVSERPAPGPAPDVVEEPVVVEGATADEPAAEEPVAEEPAAEESALAQPHLEIVPAPAAALAERNAPRPAAMVPSEPADIVLPEPPAPSGLRLVRPPSEPAPVA